MGSYAIVGAHLPIALGAAWSAQYRGTEQVAVCFFGDGTTNIGAFHEALNLAAVWKAPVVFVCENNQYMEYTAIGERDRGRRGPRPTARAPTASSRSWSTATTPTRCTASRPRRSGRARAGEGPSLIEALTYRHGGHSRADPGKYRPDDEVKAWLARDPIPTLPRARCSRRASTRRRWMRSRPRRRRQGRRGRAGGARGARSPTRRCSRPRSGPTEARRGGATDRDRADVSAAVAEGIAREMDRDPSVVLIGEDVGRGRRRVQADRGPVRPVRAASASATRRSASRRSSVRRWAPR